MEGIESELGGVGKVLAEAARVSRGHFVYESGHHGDLWLNLDALFVDARRTRGWAAALAKTASLLKPSTLVSGTG